MVQGRAAAAGRGRASRTHFSEPQVQRLERRFHEMAGDGGTVPLETLCLQPEMVFTPLFGMFVRAALLRKRQAAAAAAAAAGTSSSSPQPPPTTPLEVDLTTFIEALSAFSPSAPPPERLAVLGVLLPANADGLVDAATLFSFYHGMTGGHLSNAEVQCMCDGAAARYAGGSGGGGGGGGGVPQDALVRGIAAQAKLTVYI